MFRQVSQLRSVRVFWGLSMLLVAVCAAVPLLGTLDNEAALLLSLALGPFCGFAMASALARVTDAPHRQVLLVVVTPPVTLALLVLGGKDLLVNRCGASWIGPGLFILGFPFSLLAAGAAASLVHSILKGAGSARYVAFALPLAFAVRHGLEFWTTPGAASFGVFHGYFAGPIYDESREIPTALLWLRLQTALGICFALCTASLARRRGVAKIAAGVASVTCCMGMLGIETQRADLGLVSSTATIRERLGASYTHGNCEIVVPREMRRTDAARLLADCEFRISELQTRIGTERIAPITAYFFRSPSEKKKLMGAGSTYIAKPWRNEIYLHTSEWPHPVLAHELAHVLLRAYTSNPLGVSLSGVIPNPGLIEGAAVAMAWDADDELDPHQWSHTMLELDLLPRVGTLLSPGFFIEGSARAYTSAGSLLRFIYDKRGMDAFRAVYREGSLQAAGLKREELERQWHAYLRSVPIEQAWVERARDRMSGSSIFARPCPHDVANLKLALGGAIASGDAVSVLRKCKELARIDPGDQDAVIAKANAYAELGRWSEARASLTELEERLRLPKSSIATATHGLADIAWRRGRIEEARQLYRAIQDAPLGRSEQRVLRVKLWALSEGEPVSEEIRGALIGKGDDRPSRAVALHHAHRLTEARPELGVGAYLVGRQLYNEQRYDLAMPYLRQAEASDLPAAALREETLNMLGTALYASGQVSLARQTWIQLQAARPREAADWIVRIGWLERQRLNARSSPD